MNREFRSTRRHFIRQSSITTAVMSLPWIVPASVLGKEGKTVPSEKITLGVIGYGPRCQYVLKGMLAHPDVQCVALADVQADRRDSGKKFVDEHHGNADCTRYQDFRELLDRKDIDAVLIATGDRWHTPISILAAESGKDVYSEKPCGLTIGNCQDLAEVIRRTGRVFQAGTQRRSVANFRQAVEIAHSGLIGKIHTLRASSYAPEIKTAWLPSQPAPRPEVVDWNMWLGPAPWRPYNSQYVAGGWRGYYDFDSGARLLDWGAHTVDLCQWANQADETMPVEYEPTEKNITARYANGVKLVIQFPETSDVRSGWVKRLGTCPVRFEGDEGWVEAGDNGDVQFHPESIQGKLPQLAKKVRGLDVQAHTRDFLDCIKSRKAPAANAEVMRHSHITCHAAALSWMLNRKLMFDPAKEAFVNDDEANRLRSRSARRWDA